MGEPGSPADAGPDGPPVLGVSITPAGASIVPGGSIQMRAVAIHVDSSMSDVTDQATWSSSRPLGRHRQRVWAGLRPFDR